jgi:putative oxidoreductase
MEKYLGPYQDYAYAALRIVTGFLFLCHGLQKVLGLFGGVGGVEGQTVPIFSLYWAAGMIELVGGLLVCVGAFTGWAAFLCSGEMAVAYFMVHQPQALFPIVNKGEVAALYSFAFLLIAMRGSGPWSLLRSQ